jgi:competence protein ComEC
MPAAAIASWSFPARGGHQSARCPVISHADDDHSGGAASVAYSRRPRWLLSSLVPENALHDMVEGSVRCEAGQRWSWDGVDFAVLHPDAGI